VREAKPDEPKQTTPAGHTINVPSREDFERLVKRAALAADEIAI